MIAQPNELQVFPTALLSMQNVLHGAHNCSACASCFGASGTAFHLFAFGACSPGISYALALTFVWLSGVKNWKAMLKQSCWSVLVWFQAYNLLCSTLGIIMPSGRYLLVITLAPVHAVFLVLYCKLAPLRTASKHYLSRTADGCCQTAHNLSVQNEVYLCSQLNESELYKDSVLRNKNVISRGFNYSEDIGYSTSEIESGEDMIEPNGTRWSKVLPLASRSNRCKDGKDVGLVANQQEQPPMPPRRARRRPGRSQTFSAIPEKSRRLLELSTIVEETAHLDIDESTTQRKQRRWPLRRATSLPSLAPPPLHHSNGQCPRTSFGHSSRPLQTPTSIQSARCNTLLPLEIDSPSCTKKRAPHQERVLNNSVFRTSSSPALMSEESDHSDRGKSREQNSDGESRVHRRAAPPPRRIRRNNCSELSLADIASLRASLSDNDTEARACQVVDMLSDGAASRLGQWFQGSIGAAAAPRSSSFYFPVTTDLAGVLSSSEQAISNNEGCASLNLLQRQANGETALNVDDGMYNSGFASFDRQQKSSCSGEVDNAAECSYMSGQKCKHSCIGSDELVTALLSLPRSHKSGQVWSHGHSNVMSTLHVSDNEQVFLEDQIVANRRVHEDKLNLLEEVNIDKILGFGSMGMVYYGSLWDHKVVVKLVEHGAGVLGKEQQRGRLARTEATVSRLLVHPNLVTTYDCCTGNVSGSRFTTVSGAPGRFNQGALRVRGRLMTVIVQEYCQLGTLRDALTKRKYGLDPSSPDFLPIVLRAALDIAHGMKYLQSLGLIHTDLKAENVLLQKVHDLSTHPSNFVAKIADFGLTQVLESGSTEKFGGIHGTVSHMPPEAMRETMFSMATDVYSFGVVLWEMYTMGHPFAGMAAHQVVHAVCNEGQRLVWPEHVPFPYRALAEDCCNLDYHHRPSFHDVVLRLRDMVGYIKCDLHSTTGLSAASDLSDELEAALAAQRHHTTTRFSHRGHSNLIPELSDSGEDTEQEGGGGSAPRDFLGCMLYYLAQVPGEVCENHEDGVTRWFMNIQLPPSPLVM